MKNRLLVVGLIFFGFVSVTTSESIKGKLISSLNSSPINNASVTLKNLGIRTTSNLQGDFEINFNPTSIKVQNQEKLKGLTFTFAKPSSGKVNISLFNLSGNRVMVISQSIKGNSAINFSNHISKLDEGIYYIKLSTDLNNYYLLLITFSHQKFLKIVSQTQNKTEGPLIKKSFAIDTLFITKSGYENKSILVSTSSSDNRGNILLQKLPDPPIDLKIMSYNIAIDNQGEVKGILESQLPDVVGFQESFVTNLQDYSNISTGYGWYGVNENGDNNDNIDGLRIMYLRDRFIIDSTSSGYFWYCQNSVPGCVDFGTPYIRYCTYVRLTEKNSNNSFYIYNTHWDHTSEESQYNSVRMMTDHISKRKHLEDPVVLTGDFNAYPYLESMIYLTSDPNNPAPMDTLVFNWVDYILAEPGRYEVISTSVDANKTASDHQAILSEIKLFK